MGAMKNDDSLTKHGTLGRHRAFLRRSNIGETIMSTVKAAFVVGGVLAAAAFGVHAFAQDANPAPRVDFRDPNAPISAQAGAVSISARENGERFAPSGPAETRGDSDPRQVELQIAAGRHQTGAPVDVSFAHRTTFDQDSDRQGHGSEVRVGRGLVQQDRRENHHGSSVYAFVSSDDQALTWRPGARSEFGGSGSSIALQNQVQVGDRAAGVTYERDGVQASLAYVERDVSTHVGERNYSQDENFAGVTVTMRH
jgi:hypothetical protein